MPGILSSFKKAKTAARKFLFGERGRWSRSGTRRYKTKSGGINLDILHRPYTPQRKILLDNDSHILNANRTRLGRLKNWLGLQMFGSRIPWRSRNKNKSNKRTWLGRRKNNIESMLGLHRSRNNSMNLVQILASRIVHGMGSIFKASAAAEEERKKEERKMAAKAAHNPLAFKRYANILSQQLKKEKIMTRVLDRLRFQTGTSGKESASKN